MKSTITYQEGKPENADPSGLTPGGLLPFSAEQGDKQCGCSRQTSNKEMQRQ